MTLKEKHEAKKEDKRFKDTTSHIKLTPGDIVFNILNYLFFSLFTLSCIFPFYYIFINTISSNDLVRKGAITFIPHELTISNYIAMSNVNDLWNSFFITILRTVLGTVLMVFASALAGYLMTKQEMWHRKFWYRFLVITMYFNAGLIPTYLNLSMLGLTNTFLVYIIPAIVSPYNIILVKTYVESIPGEIEESAFIDGAGYWTIFYKIIWPLSKPILATIAIFGAVGHWNSFQDSLIYNSNSPELYTLQHRLYVYLNQSSNLSAMMNGATSSSDSTALASALNTKVIQYTISMITIIPIMLVYPFMQRYFEKGIMLGAVKG
ncbi:MAG: carbohydrate ABC transporter permease [Oscillospiraceae bacterium]|nr:carbohydrate ABC transporter permease [Oscillospiraceae bacterium]